MTTPRDTIQTDLKVAMKAGEKERVGSLRMLLTEIRNEAIRAGGEVDENRFLALVRKGIKQRQEASEQFRKGGRDEAADKEDREAVILKAYLPAQVGEEEIRAAVVEYVADQGLSGPKAMGQVMKAMMSRFGASADGRTLSSVVREVLTSS